MYNCLQKKSAKLLKKCTPHRLIASLFVFMMIMTGAQAATYWWIGGTTGNWNDAANWASTEGGTAGTNYPGDTPSVTDDEVHIYGNVEVTISSDISIGQLLIQSGTNHLTSDFTTKLSGGGSLNITDNGDAAINLTRCSGTPDVIGTLEINIPVTCTNGSIQTHSGTTLLVDSPITLSAKNVFHSAGSTPISKIQVEGTLDIETGTLTLNGYSDNIGATQLVVGTNGIVKAGIIKFDKTVYSNTSSDGTTTKITEPIINNGTIQVSDSFTIPNFTSGVTKPYSGSGSIELNGTNASFTNNYTGTQITVATLTDGTPGGTQTSTVTGSGHTKITTATFNGTATVEDCEIATATFNDTADISDSTITNATFHDDITLSGANTFTSVTATGLGGKTLTVNAEQTFQSGGTVTLSGTGDSNLLTVTGNGSGKFTLGTTTLTGEYLSLNTDSSVVSASTGTAFAQNSETTGSGTTSWIVTSASGHLWNGENGDWETAANWLPQTLPATTDKVIINSGTPKINSAVTVKSITVNGGGINLLSDSLSVEALTLLPSTSVTAAASTTINITEGQEIDEKITGAGKLVLASGKNYTIPPSTTIGIDIENNGSLSSTGAVTFSGDFTNTGSATFTGGLSIAGDLEGTGSLTGAITFNGTTNQTFTPNNVIYPGITVDKSAGTLSVENSLQVTTLTLTSGAVSINGNLTLWDGTDYQNYDFSSVAGTLTFTGGSSASPRVLTAANITNSSKISAEYLKLQAQGSSDIILNSCENISNLTLETSGNISVNGITADSLSIASGATSVKMKDTITLSSTSQDFIIDYPLLLTGDTTFSIIKDIKVQDTDGSIKSDTSAGKNLSLTANTIQLLNGNALGDSTTGALGEISINSNLTLGADTQLYSSQINFAGTGAKSLSGSYKLSATGNVSDTGAWTWATGSTLLFNGSADQTFKTNTNSTYNTIDVVKTTGKFILDTSVLNTDILTITNCEEIHFTGVNEITTVANLSFPRHVTADNNLTISNTSGTISFVDTFVSSGDLNIPDASVTFAGNVTAAAISTKETTINCSKIQTSGNQNYAGAVTLGANTELESSSGNISFTSTVDGANTLKLTSSTGTSFSGNVGASTSLTSLEVTGPTNINCTSITTSGNQTYNGTVNLKAGGTTTITGANTGAHIDFKDTINGSNTFSVTAASTTFENTVGATTSLTAITVDGIANINCSSIKTSTGQTYNDEIILQQDSSFTGSLITLNGSVSDNTTPANSYALTVNGNAATALGNSETISIPVQINGNFTNANTGTASFNNDIKVSADVTDNGSWNSADGKKLIFNGTGTQIFTPVATTTYKSILIDKSAGSFTTATNALQVSSFTDSAANASTITFATDTTIGSDVVFNTAKTVSFTNATNVMTAGSPVSYHSITHTAGLTEIEGTLTAANVTFNKTNLTDTTAIDAHGNVTFANTTSGGSTTYANVSNNQDLTITTNGAGTSTTFNGDVGKTDATKLKSLTINGDTNIRCTLIATSGNQTYNGNVNLYSNSTNSSVTLTTNTTSKIDFSGDISEDPSKQIKLAINSPVFKSTATAGNSASITVNELEFLQDTSIQSANTTAINLTVPTISGTEKTVSLTNSVSELSFNGEVEFNPNITTSTGSNLKASSETMTFKADVNFEDNSLDANNGTIILTAANKTPAGTAATLSGNNTFNNLTLQGPVTISGSNTIANLNIQNSATISGNNTITNLTAGDETSGLGDKTITFAAGSTQNVNGTLKLNGTSETSRLNLRSSVPSNDSTTGTQWTINSNSHQIKYVDVQDSNNTSANYFFAYDSWDSGNNTKWNFPGMIYNWKTNAASSDWNTASNWLPSSIPGIGANVKINAPADNTKKYPVLTEALILNDSISEGTIEVLEGAIFDLASQNLTVGTITNKGLIRLAGKTGQTITGKMINNADSSVEYYGVGSPADPTEVFVWDGDNGAGTAGKQYENLIINNQVSATADLKVTKNLTINEITALTGSIEVAENLTVNQNTSVNGTNGTIAVTGASVINCSSVSTTGNQTYNGTVSLNKTGNITLTAKNASNENQTLQFNGNVSCDTAVTPNLIINANTKLTCANVTSSGSQTYNGSLQIDNPAAIISQTDSLIFNDNVSLAADLSLTANAPGKSINFAANISDNDAGKTVTLTTEKLQSTVAAVGSATISLATLTLSQATTIGSENASSLNLNVNTINGASALTFGLSTTTFTLKDGITINPPVIIETGRAVTCAGAASFNSAVTNNGSLNGDTGTQGKTLTFEQDYTSTTGGNLTASSGLTVFKANIYLASTNFTHSNGTVSFAGSGTAQELSTKSDGSTNFFNVSISSPASVSTSSSFIVSGNSWSNTNTSGGFTATTPSVITFVNNTASTTAPVNVSGSNHFYDLVCKTTGQNIIFANTNYFDNTITLGDSTASPAIMTGSIIIGSPAPLTFNPDLNCNSLTINGPSATAVSEAVILSGNANYGDSFASTGSGNVIIKKDFTGNGNASFAGDVILNEDNNRSFSAGANHNITITNNMIIDTDPGNTIQLNTSLSSRVLAANFILYSGSLTLNGRLETSGDIIFLGSDYTTTDPQTGIDGIYLYNQTRPSPINYTAAFKAAPYNGQINALEDSTIKVGKNYYSNGITLQGPASGQLNILLPKNSDSHKGFAEAIKTSVNNCNVSCWELPSDTATDNTAPAKIAAYECTDNSGNTNWNFEDFEILNAWTERDDAVYVEFNAPVRNLYNEITNSLPYITYQGTTASRTAFTSIYNQPDCHTDDIISRTDIELTNGSYSLYLKAPDSWNTDATGKSAGSTNSSDRMGNHKASIPYLDIPRSLTAAATGTTNVNYILTNKWGKRLNNYSTRTPTAGFSYGTNETAGSETYVLDKTGPVLWSVRTGQELHTAYNSSTGEASQHSYDSHNFLEFRYSEAVDIGSITAYDPPADPSHNPNLAENVQVTDSLGAIVEGITSPATSLTFAGLAKLTAQDTAGTGSSAQLQLYTGSNGSANKYMNALYRPDPYAVRLSIAGWTDGTLTDYTGNEYKKWAGYIEKASQFTGAKVTAVSAAQNSLVKDQEGNQQIEYAEGSRIEPSVLSDTSGSYTPALLPTTPNLYSEWDLSSPVFTPLRFSRESEWGNQTMSEAIGNTNGSGSTLDRIDFHFFDNTPAYNSTDPAEWFTEIGWCIPGTEASKDNLKDRTYTYCADIIGGARQFDPIAARRTTGGIRFSTKAGIAPAFKYSTNPNNPSPSSAFVTGLAGVHTTVVSQLFTGSSSPMRPANDPDGLYLGLGLTDTSLSVETTFAFSYNEAQGYLTDLAGNRLRSKVSKTIDRTPPSFDVIISPVDTKSVYIIFVKEIVTDISKIKFRDNNGVPINLDNDTVHNFNFQDFNELIANSFRIISIDGSGNAVESTEIQIDKSIPAQIVPEFTNNSFTCLKLTTTSEIDIEQLKNLYVQLVLPEICQQAFPNGTTDPLTSNTNSRVTFIQDYLGNYMSMYSAHALSDFAINYVNPLYAYSSDMLYEDSSVMDGLYEAGSWAVHYWNADQNNYGTLPAEQPISIVADTKGNEKIRVYLSPSPDADSVSKQFNSDFNLKLRVWLPDLQDGIFRALSASNNTNFVYSDGQALEENSENTIFNLTKETVSAWKNGAQISFMFGLTEDTGNPVRIYSNPYYDIESDRFNLSLSIPVPLYCLRMPDSADISTLDLWSFKIKGVTAQRGGVTILNNVINASKDEKTVVVVDMPEDGNLTVCVMTLDGNIITYLNRGNTKAGEYYYTWNGKNRNGKAVARGMYFVRVLGGGIDETRKVMVVK